MDKHDHKYTYQGIVYVDEDHSLPGTGACRRHYAYVYFCEGCLIKRYENIPGEFNSYSTLKFPATPGSGVDKKAILR